MRASRNPQRLLHTALLCALSWGGQALASGPELSPGATVKARPHPMNAKALKQPAADPHLIPPPLPACPGMIDNATVRLGVAPAGHLNIPCPTNPVSSGAHGTSWIGLRYLPTNGEAAAPGSPCEGWGVASADLGVSGYSSAGCGAHNVTVEINAPSPISTMSVVRVGDTFRVTHIYTPTSLTNFLYQVNVLIENIGTVPVADLRYTRGIDYDILPNTFSEYVTIAGTSGNPWVVGAVDNNFVSLDPLAPNFPLMGGVGDFTNLGPGDLGAQLDFKLGALAPGEVRSFRTFYGAAGNHVDAVNALAAVGANTYSLAKGNWNGAGDPLSASGAPTGTFAATTGQPNTFMFGFRHPETPSHCTVECPGVLSHGVYTVDRAGAADRCVVNGQYDNRVVAVTTLHGERVEFSCMDYGSPYGNPCNVVPGADTCNLTVFQKLCSSPTFAQYCL
ncbi:hypothetical protein [Comamonas sp. JC664]|uniref:hypothetical protein n=1 Tax=Comamonas sp. JC664 TaxID=2801917 RepID=UPI00174E7815|nr:hypothetical protein [Comamonas sp. JC664]MBL0692149.1 hypothetical protein [Comamonas sp. JC664]